MALHAGRSPPMSPMGVHARGAPCAAVATADGWGRVCVCVCVCVVFVFSVFSGACYKNELNKTSGVTETPVMVKQAKAAILATATSTCELMLMYLHKQKTPIRNEAGESKETQAEL